MSNCRFELIDNRFPVIASPNTVFLCHDDPLTTLSDASANQILGDLSVAGTTSGIWANFGGFTAQGDNGAQFNSADQQALGDLSDDTQGARQLLIFVDMVGASNPASLETLIMYGQNGQDGWFSINSNTDGKMQFQIRENGSVITQKVNSDIHDGNRHSVLFFIDYINGQVVPFVDSELQATTSLDVNFTPSTSTRGFGVFGNIATATPTFNNQLGSGASGIVINRLGVIRPQSDIASLVGDIALGLYAVQHEIPEALNGI